MGRRKAYNANLHRICRIPGPVVSCIRRNFAVLKMEDRAIKVIRD